MKKAFFVILSLMVILVLLLNSCFGSKEKDNIRDYQYIYDGMVKEWNEHASPGCEVDSLLGYGEYLYNSYLIMFPRETPSTLEAFYFHWTPLIDVDGYAIYFTCELEKEKFTVFTEGVKNFKIQNGENELAPLYDNTHFSLPTYILQWTNVEEKWEVLEYIMLDEENSTVVFVYTMGELEYIVENSDYSVTPSEMHFLDEDFSIYDDFENSTYDISFLECLK